MAREIAFVVLVLQVVVNALRAEGAKFSLYGDERSRRRDVDAFARGATKNAGHHRALSFGFIRVLPNSQQSSFADSVKDTKALEYFTTSPDEHHAGPTTLVAPDLPTNPTERYPSPKASPTVNGRSRPDVQATDSESSRPTSFASSTSAATKEGLLQVPEKNETAQQRQRRRRKKRRQSRDRRKKRKQSQDRRKKRKQSRDRRKKRKQSRGRLRLPKIAAPSSVPFTTVAQLSNYSQETHSPPLLTTNSVSQPLIAHSSPVAVPSTSTSNGLGAPEISMPSSITSTTIDPLSTHTEPTLSPTLLTTSSVLQTMVTHSSAVPSTLTGAPANRVQPHVYTSTTWAESGFDTTTTLRTTTQAQSKTPLKLTYTVPPVTAILPDESASESIMTLADDGKHEVIFKPSQKQIIVEPEWAPGTTGSSRSQLVMRVLSSHIPSQRLLTRTRLANPEYVHVEELIFCGGLNSRAYVFDSDPRKSKFLEQKYSASVSSISAEICANGVRILVPSSSYETETYVVLSSNLQNPNSALTATAFLRKNQYPKYPWNARVLRDSIPVTNASVAKAETSIFLISSAPWTRHEELRNAQIDDFKADGMDPFCDQTGTTMVSLIAGASLGLADRVRIIPIPVGGCDPGNGDLHALLRALEEAAQRLSKPRLTTSKAVVVFQDSEILQNGLGNGKLQDVLSRIAQLGALAVIPISKCSSLSGMEGQFLSVGSFGFDASETEALQSDDLVLSKNLSACTSSIDLVAPGIGVTGAGTFGSLARRQITDTSAAAAATVGWLLATSASVPAKLFHVEHVRTAAISLPSNIFKNIISGSGKAARVIGYGNGSRYLQFAAALRDENISNSGTSGDGKRDRIVSAISNPTFYGITAGVFVACVAAAAGIGILAARRGSDADSVSSAAESDFPPSPPAHKDVECGLEGFENSSAIQLQKIEEQADISGDTTVKCTLKTTNDDGTLKTTVVPQGATSQRQQRAVHDSEKDSDRSSENMQSKGVVPLKLSRNAAHGRQAGIDLDSSSSDRKTVRKSSRDLDSSSSDQWTVMRKSASGSDQSGKRRNVKTRLLTITKPQKPAASPGGSKASWFATPKAGVKPVSDFTEKDDEAERREEDADGQDAKGTSPAP